MTESNKQQFYINLGLSIQKARKESKLSQSDLAEKVGLSRASIVNIEKGRQNPAIHLIWQFSEIFKRNLSDIIPNFQIDTSDSNILEKEILKRTQLKQIDSLTSEKLTSFITNKG